jgi:DNA topoisomerase VI subunit B
MAKRLNPQQATLFAAPAASGKAKAKSGGSSRKSKPAKKTRTVIKLSKTKAQRAKARSKAARKTRGAPRRAASVKRKRGAEPETAQSMAAKQREISVSEFFTKNRHLLGFDNPRKALLTAIKEAVDNALDACEEAHILPDLFVEIIAVEGAEDRFRVAVTDNGPGIVKAQIPKIFGKLLYGSKFHRLKMSRGQQGIGISAAGMYGQLTTGRPMCITSRTGAKTPAHYYEVQLDTIKNQPQILREDEVEWDQPRGTRVELELEARFQRGRQSVDEYLQQTAVANPHARIIYHAPDGEKTEFPRATKELPLIPREIKPHPYGLELGALISILRQTRSRNLSGCLQGDFTRVSSRLAKDICDRAKLTPRARPSRIANGEAERLYRAIQNTKIMNPPTDCLAPIGEEALIAGLRKEYEADFYSAVTRPPRVYRGNPFLVEAAIAYGGKLPAEGLAKVLRFANRVPLLYQQGSCAIWESVLATAWRNYHVNQSRGAPPAGPLVISVHFASVWVPFTSESKEAIASYPNIIKETKLCLQECGRRLSVFLSRRRREDEEQRKRDYIEMYIPHIGIGLREILKFSQTQEKQMVKKLKGMLKRARTN